MIQDTIVEKRKYRRLETNLLVRIRHVPVDKKTEAEAISKITNLSLGGVFIATPTPLTKNRIVELEFEVPGYSDTVRAKGIVRWSAASGDKQGMGIEFLEVSVPSESALANYIKSAVAEETVATVNKTPAHHALFRIATESWGKTISIEEVASRTGFSVESLSGCVRDFARVGLVTVKDKHVTFVTPSDPTVLKRLGEIVV